MKLIHHGSLNMRANCAYIVYRRSVQNIVQVTVCHFSANFWTSWCRQQGTDIGVQTCNLLQQISLSVPSRFPDPLTSICICYGKLKLTWPPRGRDNSTSWPFLTSAKETSYISDAWQRRHLTCDIRSRGGGVISLILSGCVHTGHLNPYPWIYHRPFD